MASEAQADIGSTRHAGGEDSDDGDRLLAYFFVPLPEPVGLPHGWIARFMKSDQSELERAAGLAPTERLTASVAVHQLQEEMSTTSIETAFRAAAAAFGWQATRFGPTYRSPAVTAGRTVFEVMVPITEDSEPCLQDGFEHATACCERLLRSYYVITQHPVPVLTAARLPPVVPYAVRRAKVAEASPTWPKNTDARMLANPSSSHLRSEPPTLDQATIESLPRLSEITDHTPFSSLADIRRELLLAAQTGATIPAAILCGAAAEVLFRELLLLLLWEEGRTPEWAREVAAEVSVSKLVTREFHARLGGPWSKANGVIGSWARDIAQLRNRTVHRGYRPSAAEVGTAATTYLSLERFVGDRLTASLNGYPLTARAFLGTAGLKRRQAEKQLVRRLQSDLHPTDVPATFERWRRELERHVASGPWVGQADGAAPMLVIYSDGRTQWWLMDDRTGLCCLAAEPEQTSGQIASLKRLLADLAGIALSEHVSFRLEGSAAPLDDPPAWIPTYEVLPLNTISRFPLSVMPPPEARTGEPVA